MALSTGDVQINLTPQTQAKLDKLVRETGRNADDLGEDAQVGYLDEVTQVREVLNTRYDELKSGLAAAIARGRCLSPYTRKESCAPFRTGQVSDYALHPEALADIEEIWEYIRKRQPGCEGPRSS